MVTLFFFNFGTIWVGGWGVVSATHRPEEDPAPIVQEVGRALGTIYAAWSLQNSQFI
jgi:hypothetical protein